MKRLPSIELLLHEMMPKRLTVGARFDFARSVGKLEGHIMLAWVHLAKRRVA